MNIRLTFNSVHNVVLATCKTFCNVPLATTTLQFFYNLLHDFTHVCNTIFKVVAYSIFLQENQNFEEDIKNFIIKPQYS
jgi:hypothetical protein